MGNPVVEGQPFLQSVADHVRRGLRALRRATRRKAAPSRTWVQPRKLPNECWPPSPRPRIGTHCSAPSIPPQRLHSCLEVSLARQLPNVATDVHFSDFVPWTAAMSTQPFSSTSITRYSRAWLMYFNVSTQIMWIHGRWPAGYWLRSAHSVDAPWSKHSRRVGQAKKWLSSLGLSRRAAQ